MQGVENSYVEIKLEVVELRAEVEQNSDTLVEVGQDSVTNAAHRTKCVFGFNLMMMIVLTVNMYIT